LQAACKYDLKNDLSPSYSSEEPHKIATFCTENEQKDTVFVQLKRVYMYLARISLGHVKGTGGNESSGQYLLSLQEEWAHALYDYETTGIAIKTTHAKMKSDDLKNLVAVCRTKNQTEGQDDRNMLSSVMRELAEKLGHPYQADLLDES